MKILSLVSLIVVLLWGLDSKAEVYGRLKVNWMQADNILNSFSNPNMSAVTSAANSDVVTEKQGSRSTFQYVQSRIGGKFHYNKKVLALMEFDFIDFAQASPTTSAHPRVRRAFIRHQLTDHFSIQVGEDWDVFSPLNPNTFNYIGNYFHAGNIGFMRNQFIGRYSHDNDEYSVALGQAGKSSSPADTELETKQRTSLAVSYRHNIDKSSVLMSLIYANRDFNAVSKKVWGANLGYVFKGQFLSLESEIYMGEGLSKLAVLSLPSEMFGHEYGGYITTKYNVKDDTSVYFGTGVAYAENEGVSTYDSTKQSMSVLGARRNTLVKIGASKTLDAVKYYTEISQYQTDYEKEFQAKSLELGALLYF
jgi:hypothetical protein